MTASKITAKPTHQDTAKQWTSQQRQIERPPLKVVWKSGCSHCSEEIFVQGSTFLLRIANLRQAENVKN